MKDYLQYMEEASRLADEGDTEGGNSRIRFSY